MSRESSSTGRAPCVKAMLGFLGCSLSLVLLAGCDLPGKPDPAERPVRPDEVLTFDALYQENCAACHGAEGKMGAAPPLNDPLFLAIVPDKEVLQIIRAGRSVSPNQKSMMPAFEDSKGGGLTEAQVQALANGLKKHWVSKSPISHPVPYLQPRGERNKQAGEQAFARACAACHGMDGKGQTEQGKGIVINDRAFLALISDQALRRIIITGRPDLGMPNYAESAGRPKGYKPLTSGEIADVVALLAYWRQGGSINGK